MEAENAAITEEDAQQAILKCTATGPSTVNIGWKKRSTAYTDATPAYTTLSDSDAGISIVQDNYDTSSFTRISTLTIATTATTDTNYYTCSDDTVGIEAEITLEVIGECLFLEHQLFNCCTTIYIMWQMSQRVVLQF